MMSGMKHVTAGLLAVIFATPVSAACNDELAALDAKVKTQATAAIASSSSGQGTAAKRNGQAIASRDKGVPVTDLPKAPAPGTQEADSARVAAQAGGSGDRVMQAKASLNDARVAQGKGDEATCLAAVAKAKRQLDD